VVDVSIVVPTHNRARLLERTLESLALVDLPSDVNVEIVVVASACSDDSLDVVSKAGRTFPCTVRAIEETHAGLSRARNRGLEAVQADLIAFLDDDVWVEQRWLTALVQAAAQSPADLFAGRVTLECEGPRPEWMSRAVERLLSANDLGDEMRECAGARFLVGANFALRRSVAATVGGFSVTLGRSGSDLLSGEESELVSRALTAGHALLYVPGMAVRHWIPRQRATAEHLEAIAFGRGRARALLLTQRQTGQTLATARLGAAQVLLGSLRELEGWWQGDASKKLAARLLRQRGLGAVTALLHTRARTT
jgi:GT2 family glycosyltransferase